MKLILDTNVFVAAGFNPNSSSMSIVKAIKEGKHQNIWNEDTKRETKKILKQIPPIKWSKFKSLFDKRWEFKGKLSPQNYTLIEDKDDRKFAALAKVTSSILITNDSHFLSVRKKLNLKIKTPKEIVQ